jgi:hypothetical protein
VHVTILLKKQNSVHTYELCQYHSDLGDGKQASDGVLLMKLDQTWYASSHYGMYLCCNKIPVIQSPKRNDWMFNSVQLKCSQVLFSLGRKRRKKPTTYDKQNKF